MSNVTQITSHVNDALRRLLEQYKNMPLIRGLLNAMVSQIQDIENAVFDMDKGRLLFDGTNFVAEGTQLDTIGEIVGVKRNGLDDSTYLVIILGTIGENFSDTTADAVRNVIRTVYECSTVFLQTPNSNPGPTNPPACIGIGVGDPQIDTDLYPLVQKIIQKTIGAGITLLFVTAYDAENGFAFDGPQDGLGGFGDVDDAEAGGEFGTLIFSNPIA